MKSILSLFVAVFLSSQSSFAQLKPDELKVRTTQIIASCFSVYGTFQKTGDATYLVKGTRYAAQASILISLLKDSSPKILKAEDADKIIFLMDGLSVNIPERFVGNPLAVTQDAGFITFLHLSRGSIEEKLGKLPEVKDEE